MVAQEHRMDAISNNIANADTEGYKRDTAAFKAFPELMLRRLNEEIVPLPPSRVPPPLGSVDTAPVVGRLGTGVELNEIYTVFEQGSLKQTENPFDMALESEGFFVVDTPTGERLTRNGSFHLGPEGLLVTKEGYPVLGENGPIAIKKNNFVVDQNGRVYENDEFPDDPERLIAMIENEWGETEMVDRLRLESVPNPRYLRKQGSSLWRSTDESGEQLSLEDDVRPRVRQGFLESSNVNSVTEMVQMIEVNRAYEANQKVLQAQDSSTGRLINDVMRL
jgi:flagellar basal-body rod protein FlgG